MPIIKIHELPQKTADTIDDADLMVIEDLSDTKKIRISDLRALFSNDKKLEAISTSLSNQVAALSKTTNDAINTIDNTVKSLSAKVANIYDDTDAIKNSLAGQQENIAALKKAVSDNTITIKDLEASTKITQQQVLDHTDTINVLLTENENLHQELGALGTLVAAHTTSIENINNELAKINQAIETITDTIEDRILNTVNECKAYTDTMYDNVMKYIEYYHHTSTNPPNFDEPYRGDIDTVKYIMPIGSIFQTSDKEFKPNTQFPGEWKYCGVGISINADDARKVYYYTWVRIS